MDSRYILVKDEEGYKFDGTLIYAYKRLTGGAQYSCVNLERGELLEKINSTQYNFKLCRDPSIFLKCSEHCVAPLHGSKEFLLMEGIGNPAERYKSFISGQLQYGLKLAQGSEVYVAPPGCNQYVRATIRFIGKVGALPGTIFGVEILVRITFNNILKLNVACDLKIGRSLQIGYFRWHVSRKTLLQMW